MQITFTLNHKKVTAEIAADTVLLDLVRSLGCKSVKRGCETANCGLCTVFLDEKPVLSCSVLAARVNGRSVTTLEGLQEEAAEFGAFIADQGAEQCGFCNPGFIMNALALFRENPDPGEDEADTIRLNALERQAVELFDGVVSTYDGTRYRYSIESIGTEADTALKCHYVNVRILFNVLNVK